jgi:hypothetical protein
MKSTIQVYLECKEDVIRNIEIASDIQFEAKKEFDPFDEAFEDFDEFNEHEEY